MYAVVFYTAGPKWKKGRPAREQELADHDRYQQTLVQSGKLKMGGPFASIAGGMAVLEVASMEEAQKLAAEDPAVTSQVMRSLVQEWEPSYLGNNAPSSQAS